MAMDAQKAMKGVEGQDGGAEFLRLDDDDITAAAAEADSLDPFSAQLLVPHMPIVADTEVLRNLSVAEVLVRRWPNKHLPAQYFRIMDPDIDLVMAPCGHVFYATEYAMLGMCDRFLPFSRVPLSGSGHGD
jgi:hypothetical protein